MPDTAVTDRPATPSRSAAAASAAPVAAPAVAFVVGGLYTEASGVARIVCDLANALARQGLPVPVYAADCHGEAAGHMLQAPIRLHAFRGQWLGRLSRSAELRRRLAADMPAIDVVHNHRVWMLPNHYSSQLAA